MKDSKRRVSRATKRERPRTTVRPRLPHVAAPLVVAMSAFLAFFPALGNGFVTWDDDRNFLNNAHYRGLGLDNLRWMWTTFHMGHYVPLSWMTLGLDYVVWGMNPTGYHLTNVLLHVVAAVLVYFIARRILRAAQPDAEDRPGMLVLAAAVAALLFAIHPLRVESVAWATERRDVLSMCLFLATTLTYLRSLDASPKRRSWYWLSIGLFLCALLSKATAMTVPAVLLIVNAYPLRRLGGAQGWRSAAPRRVYAEIAPFAALSAAAALLSIVALHPPNQLTLGAKVAVSVYSLGFYVVKTIVPMGLSPLYQMPLHVDPFTPRFLLSYVAVALMTVLAFIAVVRDRWIGVAVALLSFLIITLPMLGIVQNGPQIAADRYTYFAAPVISMLAAAGLLRLRRPYRVAGVVVAASAILVLGGLTWRQLDVWHDSKSLWSRVLAIEPQSSVGNVAMASLLMNEGKLGESIRRYEDALAQDPGYAEGHNNLGVALAREGKLAEAKEEYAQALRIKPDYDEPHGNLGVVLAEQGDVPGAIEEYEQALVKNPEYADAQVNWGNALVRLGKPADALAHYAQAVADRPDDAEAHFNWGVALAREGRFADAADHFRAALAINSQYADAKADLDQALRLMQERVERPR